MEKYNGSQTPILFRHNVCDHVWRPIPANFIHLGSRCPNCVYSRGEKAVKDTLDALSIEYQREKSFDWLGRYRFDFWLPNERIAIEYDGRQHFEAVELWGGVEALERTQASDAIKDAFCLAENIDLLRIPYTDFDIIAELVSEFIEDTRTFNELFAPNNEEETVGNSG